MPLLARRNIAQRTITPREEYGIDFWHSFPSKFGSCSIVRKEIERPPEADVYPIAVQMSGILNQVGHICFGFDVKVCKLDLVGTKHAIIVCKR